MLTNITQDKKQILIVKVFDDVIGDMLGDKII